MWIIRHSISANTKIMHIAHVAVQVVLNIAVVTNFIPNTGVSLPFISYGGTASFFLLLEMGIVLNISSKIRLER